MSSRKLVAVSKQEFDQYVSEHDLYEIKGGYNNPRDIFVHKSTGDTKAVKQYEAPGQPIPDPSSASFTFHGWSDTAHSPSYYLRVWRKT